MEIRDLAEVFALISPSTDPDRQATYSAEEFAWFDWWEEEGEGWQGDDGAAHDDLTPDEAAALVSTVFASLGDEHPPAVVFDVPDDGHVIGHQIDVAAFYRSTDDTLHFHPTIALRRWTVLHEIAHSMRPRDGHGPQFRGVLVALIEAHYGDRAGSVLLAAFDDHELDVDEDWLESTRPT